MNMRLRSRREDGRLRLAVLAACDVGVRYLCLDRGVLVINVLYANSRITSFQKIQSLQVLKIGNKSKVESGINAAFTVAL